MALSNSKITASVTVNAKSTPDLGTSSATRALSAALTLAAGTGAGQADIAFTDTRTLAASATEDLDLAGALVGVEGAAVVFARIKAIVITAAAGNTNNVVVSRPASNGLVLFSAASDAIPIRPGGFLAVGTGAADATGIVVTAGTGDLLTITNSSSGTGVDYSIAVVGCSA
jgi:hypothetical protein